MKWPSLALASLSIIALSAGSCAQETSVNPPAPSPTTESSVNFPATETAQSSNPLRSGTFVSGEHTTEGTARIVEKDGKSILELDEAFKTSESGPDLVVVLHRSQDVIGSTTPPAYPIKEGEYVIIAPLQKYSGPQSYPIPDKINLKDFQSAVIWCRQFNATFGAARLE